METAARDAAVVQGERSETAHKISTRPKRTLNRMSAVKPANTFHLKYKHEPPITVHPAIEGRVVICLFVCLGFIDPL